MRLRFGRLTARDIETILTRDTEMSAADAREAAALANGSVGQALALGSTDLAVLRETAMVLLRQSPQAPRAARLQAAALITTGTTKKDRTREEVALILQMVASMLRDIELLNAGGEPQSLANPGLIDDLQPLQRAYRGRPRARGVCVCRQSHRLDPPAIQRGAEARDRVAGVCISRCSGCVIAVFLDRDGTILDELGYLTPDSTVHVYPFSIDAIRLLARAGFAVVVITNQGGIGLGLYDHAFVDRTHGDLSRQFEAGGATIDGWYYCPHHPEAVVAEFKQVCGCRKPATGLVTDSGQGPRPGSQPVVGGRRSVARHRGGPSYGRAQRAGPDRLRPPARTQLARRDRASDDRCRQSDGGGGSDSHHVIARRNDLTGHPTHPRTTHPRTRRTQRTDAPAPVT